MHATLIELLENLKPGLLWVRIDGAVRYANREAAARTGLAVGRKLCDPDLARAVTAAVAGRMPRMVTAVGHPSQPGGAAPELQCRVVPGFSSDDAFVLITPDASADHGAAFDNLLQVIDSDLREPLRSASEALQFARADGTDVHVVDALCDRVDLVLQTLGKLVDLAGVWGSSALLANDRIKLWPLLQKVWGEIEPVAIERSIKVRFQARSETDLVTLYGSEAWLARVFLECLESALRAARPGSTLLIEYRQMGPRALIVFHDCGVFATFGRDAVELPGIPAASNRGAAPARLGAREQIGLKLCQHIVALHGGQLREEVDDGLRNFLIDLPTGAPHRVEQDQFDIAQAQLYAQDLAALMARARTSARASVNASTP